MTSQQTETSNRPGVAIITNSLPPYRIHVHTRISRELQQVRLWTLCTHEGEDGRWMPDPPAAINNVSFRNEPGTADRHAFDLQSWRKGGRVIRWLKDNDIRAVIVLGWNDLLRVRVVNWCRANHVPCFIWGDSNIHSDHVSGVKRFIKKLLLGRLLGRVSGMLACGSAGRDYFGRYGVPADRVYYFPNEPDYELIWDIPAERVREIAAKHGLDDPSRKRMVYSGRLVQAKRIDLLIDAFAKIADHRPDWDVLIIGDGPLRASLEARVPAQLKARVLWTGFLSDQSEVSALYRASDLLILPSSYEPWALVVNEAAAAGMAIVCSDIVGAAPELVRDGVNGATFRSGDLQDLVDKILAVTRSPAQLQTYKEGSGRVLQEWRKRADPVDGLVKALAAVGVLRTPGDSPLVAGSLPPGKQAGAGATG